MNKKLVLVFFIIIIIIIYVLINIIINNNENGNIVEIKINLDEISNKVYTFKDEENIKIALDIANYLETYNSFNSKFGVYQDVEYKIVYENGKTISKIYKQIYPIQGIFEELINSDEYKRQYLSIFEPKALETDKLILYAKSQDKRYIEIIDKEDIKTFIEVLREYYLNMEWPLYHNVKDTINNICIEFPEESEIFEYYEINPQDPKLINALKELDIYKDLIINAEDIEYMTFTNWDKSIDVYDKKIIQLAIDNAEIHGSGATVMQCYATTKYGIQVIGNFYRDNIPMEIQQLL